MTRADRLIRQCEGWMIDDIRSVRAEFQVVALGKLIRLVKRHVDRGQTRSVYDVSPHIPECARSRSSKRSDVKPRIDALAACDRSGISNHVRVPQRIRRKRETVVDLHSGCKWTATLRDEVREKRPAADCGIQRLAGIRKSPAAAERKFISRMSLEHVAYVEVRGTVVSHRIVGTLVRCVALLRAPA